MKLDGISFIADKERTTYLKLLVCVEATFRGYG